MSITSVQALSDRLNFFSSSPEPIPATSTLYVSHALKEVAGKKERTIVGMHLIIDADNAVHQMLNTPATETLVPAKPQVKLNALLIVCDTLEINCPLRLPECDVTIHARQLKFGHGAFIDTSPLAWQNDKGSDARRKNPGQNEGDNGEDGKNGRHAGAITLWLGSFEHDRDEMDGDIVARRFRARGGDGQHPGQGENGDDGHVVYTFTSHQTEVYNDYAFLGKTINRANMKFDPPAVYVHWEWEALKLFTAAPGSRGSAEWPTHGQHALAPGQPGEPGNGGRLTGNRAVAEPSLFDNKAGNAGRNGKKVTGGKKGGPDRCAWYQCALTSHPWNEYDVGVDYKKEENPNAPMQPGNSFLEKAALKKVGDSPKLNTINCDNAWLHPLLLQCTLTYVRDAFLTGQYDQVRKLLEAYGQALAQPQPVDELCAQPWKEASARLLWRTAQCEIATLLQRLDSQLDYYGNPPGYMPLLSLQGTLRNYSNEIDSALRTMTLARWVEKQKTAVLNMAETARLSIKQLNDNTVQIAAQLPDAEKQAAALVEKVTAVTAQQTRVLRKIGALKKELEDQAKYEEQHKAQLKFALNVASALCYVIPYGQPILGAVANAAAGAAESLLEDDKTWNETVASNLEKASKDWSSTWKDYQKGVEDSNKAAKTAADDAEKAAKRDGKEKEFKHEHWTAEKDKAKGEVDRWGTALDGLAPALSKLGSGISALRVPESKVAAKLAMLEKKDPKFQEVSKELRELLEQKQRLMTDLAVMTQRVCTGYSTMASNAANILNWNSSLADGLTKLDLEATLFMAQLDQRARLSLVEALYSVVKAYETTVFKSPKNIPWKLDTIFDKIMNLLETKQESAAEMLTKAEALRSTFETSIVGEIAKQLTGSYRFGEASCLNLEYSLSASKLSRLSQHQSVVVDPVRKGLIPEDRQRAFLDRIELHKEGLEFAGPVPKSGNAIIKLRVAEKGIVRCDGKLYCVQRDSKREWIWTYHFNTGKLQASVPSVQSEELLDLILKSGEAKGKELKQKLSMPPAWSDLILDVSYSGITQKQPPIQKLTFNFWIDSLPAADDEVVLEWRCDDPARAMQCMPSDKGKQGVGHTQFFGIFERNSVVSLSVCGGAVAWDLPSDIEVESSPIELVPEGDAGEHHPGGEAPRHISGQQIRLQMSRHLKVRSKANAPVSAVS